MLSKKSRLVLVFFLLASAQTFAGAQDSSDLARDVLIQKFEALHARMAPSDPTYVNLALRLGDLLAEKGRQVENREIAEGCTDCTKGGPAREKALFYYSTVLPQLKGDQRYKVLLQIGDIHERLGQVADAKRSLFQVLEGSPSEQVKSEVMMTLGEMSFRRQNYSESVGYYEKALAYPNLKRKSLANYRLAWGLFHQGHVSRAAEALKKMLATPSLLATNPDATATAIDEQFHAEVAKDYVSFLVKLPASQINFRQAYELFPESLRQENTIFMASELARLGEKEKSLEVWNFAFEKSKDPDEKMHILGYFMVLYREMGQPDKSLQAMTSALAFVANDLTCADAACQALRVKMRNHIVAWNKAEKTQPSAQLKRAYEAYTSRFADDDEMRVWAAQNAFQMKDLALALKHYRLLAESETSDAETREAHWLRVLDIAEQMGEVQALADIRLAYLAKSPQQSRGLDVRYQMAYDLYKAEDYKASSESFKEITTNCTTESLCVKAAHLALDSLAQLKDDVRIKIWATEFGIQFSSSAKEFRDIANKSTMNMAVQMATGDPSSAYAGLLGVDETSLSQADRINHKKNQLILAERLKKFADGRRYAMALLGLEGISDEDREFAHSRLAWFHELAFNFADAYSQLKKLTMTGLSPDQKELKLALMAELAQEKSAALKHYEKVVALAASEQVRVAAAFKVFDLSETERAKKTAYQKHKALLDSRPDELGYRLFSRGLLAELSGNPNLRQSKWAQLVVKQGNLKLIESWINKVKSHEVVLLNDAKLQKSLKDRIKLLQEGDRLLDRSLESKDAEGQLVVVKVLGRENRRFYDELMSLPLPEGLSEEEQSQYMQALFQKATPYQARAAEFEQQLKSYFVTGKKIQDEIQNRINVSTAEEKPILLAQARLLKSELTEELGGLVLGAPDENPRTGFSQEDLQQQLRAREQLIEDPLNPSKIKALLEIEKKNSSSVMADYLESRLSQQVSANVNKGERTLQ